MKYVQALTGMIALALAGCVVTQPQESADPELVTLEGALTNRFLKASEGGTVRARIRIGTRELERHRRPPANLALVVDTSGSMRGQPIEDARDAALALLDALADDDILSVIVFHSRGEVLVPATRLSDEARKEVRARIGTMQARGTTDLQDGLALGLQEVTRYPQEGINRVVLLSDGIPNDAQSIGGLAEAARQHGVSITALGLGLEYDESLLAEVARRSGGQFHYVAKTQQVAAVFRDEVLKLQRAVAAGLALRLMPGPGVVIERVMAAAAIVRVVAMARAGDLGGAEAALDAAELRTREAAARFDDDELRGQAEAMKELRGALPSLVSQAELERREAEDTFAQPALQIADDAPATVRRVHAEVVECLQNN